MNIVVRRNMTIPECPIAPGGQLAEVRLQEGVTLGQLADAICNGTAVVESIVAPVATKPKPRKKSSVSK